MTSPAASFYDLFETTADRDPDAVAIQFRETATTYGELVAEVERVARGLDDLGVERGERVLMFAGNSPAVLATYLAVARLGAVFTPVNSSFRAREGRYILANAQPRVAIVETELLAEFRQWGPADDVELVALGGGSHATHLADVTAFEALGREARDDDALRIAPRPRVTNDDPVLLCYTSGTTSTPKPVLHSHGSEVYNAKTYASVWGLGPEDRGVVALPVTWVYGLSTTSMALLTSGGTVVLLERFHPVLVLEAIAAQRATAMWGTMSMYAKLLDVLKDRTADLSSLRVVVNGGEPCPPPVVQAFEERSQVTLLGSYATSEVRPVLVVSPDSVAVPEGSAGQLVPGAEIFLEGPDGREADVGEPGHALLRCPGMLTEYYREPELTRERVTEQGWFRTGDILTRDRDGFFFVVGRQSDMIIRSGVNIAPAEVEAALLALPEVAAAAVVGVPDPRSGEAVHAYVVLSDAATRSAEELREAVASQLATYKVPEQIRIVSEFPVTATGKLDRRALRGEGEAPVAPEASR